MMGNLFTIFDPSTQIFHMSLNWLSLMLLFIFIPYNYWSMNNKKLTLISLIMQKLSEEINTLLGQISFKGAPLMLLVLFTFIFTSNIMGLMPYIFTPTSHPILTVTLALPFWVALIIFGWYNHTKHMLAHLVPQGTPVMLMSFMVLIETISNLIRPLTLSIRLAANMIAGHLLLTLLGNQGSQISTWLMPVMLITQLLLLTLESAVAMIQAYVFIILMTLYMSESSYDHT